MSEEPTQEKEEKKGFRLSTEVIVALVSLAGVGITAYFGYLQTTAPYKYAQSGTQTAEAHLTQVALSATATATPITPTNTETATEMVPTNTATQSPSKTPTRTPYMTPTDDSPKLRYCVNAYSVNVRAGPGRKYGVIGNLRGEDCLYFDGSNVEGTWLRIADNQTDSKFEEIAHGWVYIELLGLLENSSLPEMTLTPTPTLTPTHTLTPSPTRTPSPTWTPTLTLTPSPTETSTFTLTPTPIDTPTTAG